MPPSVARLDQAQPPRPFAFAAARARHTPLRVARGSQGAARPTAEGGNGE
jgi:hypothetical protein